MAQPAETQLLLRTDEFPELTKLLNDALDSKNGVEIGDIQFTGAPKPHEHTHAHTHARMPILSHTATNAFSETRLDMARQGKIPYPKAENQEELRRGVLTVGGQKYGFAVKDLPCIIESHRTFNEGKTMYKTGEVSQAVYIDAKGGDTKAAEGDMPRKDDTFVEDSGITPPTRNIRIDNFRHRPPTENDEDISDAAELIRNALNQDEVQWQIVSEMVPVDSADARAFFGGQRRGSSSRRSRRRRKSSEIQSNGRILLPTGSGKRAGASPAALPVPADASSSGALQNIQGSPLLPFGTRPASARLPAAASPSMPVIASEPIRQSDPAVVPMAVEPSTVEPVRSPVPAETASISQVIRRSPATTSGARVNPVTGLMDIELPEPVKPTPAIPTPAVPKPAKVDPEATARAAEAAAKTAAYEKAVASAMEKKTQCAAEVEKLRGLVKQREREVQNAANKIRKKKKQRALNAAVAQFEAAEKRLAEANAQVEKVTAEGAPGPASS